jgi:hypothetical protein
MLLGCETSGQAFRPDRDNSQVARLFNGPKPARETNTTAFPNCRHDDGISALATAGFSSGRSGGSTRYRGPAALPWNVSDQDAG